VPFGPYRTFVTTAANVFFEPTPDLLILCCVRSQRSNCCGSVNFYAAARRENRSFMRAAVETTRSRIKSRAKLAFAASAPLAASLARGFSSLLLSKSNL
jgi:hypothetical protein